MRAYTRVDARPVRRRYGITHPDAVVVLDASLVREANVTAGLDPDGLLLVNAERPFDTPHPGRAIFVPGSQLALGGHVNVVMLGALAAALAEPALDELLDAAEELFGAKKRAALASSVAAIEAGYAAVEEPSWVA
jgi:pyruvate ferredoxin oxidoreductase gamma subunit